MKEQFTDLLLLWYDTHQRNLPWRMTKNPYKIWISEIILQQTRVNQGMEYYLRFIKHFPDVQSLAKASQDEVLRLWQGLGYYTRARNLHAAAQQVVASGGFPNTYNKIKELKGVGEYTAAAIASFAFGEAVAAVDGNVNRVLARYFGIEDAVDCSRGKKVIHTLAQQLIPKDELAADFNQAIMDFGALQCTPQSPDCAKCPMVASCHAHATGKTDHYPVKNKVTRTRHRYFNYFHIQCGGECLLYKRKGKDIWTGLYEPFLFESENDRTAQDVIDIVLSRLSETSVDSWQLQEEGVVHKLSHQTLHTRFFMIRLNKKNIPAGWTECEEVWVDIKETDHYAMPVLVSDFYKRWSSHFQ